MWWSGPGLTWGGRCRSAEGSHGEDDSEGGGGDLHGSCEQRLWEIHLLSQDPLQGFSAAQAGPFYREPGQ